MIAVDLTSASFWTAALAALSVLLMVAEVVIPGGVVFFIGLAGLLVAGLRWIGLASSPEATITLWALSSVALVYAFAGVVRRISQTESTYQGTDEDVAAFGRQVEVVIDCVDDADSGRISFQGTSWPARSMAGVIRAGSLARIVHRDNLLWVVEPLTGKRTQTK